MTSVDLQPAQQSQRPPRPLSASRAQRLLLGLALVIGVLAVYYPVHWQPFADYDDPDYVTDNMHVKAGLHWETVQWAMRTRDAANWHPLTWLSHALDWQLFGSNPAGAHDVNVAFQLLNALLLFWVLYRATGFVGRSWMVAALFALHPINVESVAWIAERKNLLSMFFFLLALGAYRWYAERPKDTRYLLVAALFACGLMSKPQVITFPFVLLLWDYWPLQRISFGTASSSADTASAKGIPPRPLSTLIWEKVPLFALCLMSAVLTIRAQSGGGATSGFARGLRLENAVISYVRYLGKACWPSSLALFYPFPLVYYKVWQVVGAALLLLAITAMVALAYRRRYLTVGWLWFLGTLVPMIGLKQVGTQALADRYGYLPFVGLFIMVCWWLGDWAGAIPARLRLIKTLAAAVLIALAVTAHHQVEFWNDYVTLWTHAIEVTHNNWVAENNLGTTLLKEGRLEEAIPHFRAGYVDYPYDPNCILNLGVYEQMHHNYPAAIDWYRKATEMARNPRTQARAFNNLGYAYKATGDLVEARENLKKAVQIDPEYVGAWISLGVLAQRTGELPLAVEAYSRAEQLRPTDYGYLLLAGALDASGQKEKADAARQQAALLSNNLLAAQRHADDLLNR